MLRQMVSLMLWLMKKKRLLRKRKSRKKKYRKFRKSKNCFSFECRPRYDVELSNCSMELSNSFLLSSTIFISYLKENINFKGRWPMHNTNLFCNKLIDSIRSFKLNSIFFVIFDD
eukprot:GFUD01048661.1.p1 GENE.GFUD01048661.1~~GFUD01048661.1.p1  ORF type:complete len:115 (+),score=10.27 GFUD01048661.1:155-499(+)